MKPDQTSHPSDRLRPPTLDDIIEAFEIVWNRNGAARIEDFLPGADHPDFELVAMELLCVDLERRCHAEDRRTVDEYIEKFPELLSIERIMERLAFEEYRWLRERGDSVRPEEYAERYQISTDDWPDPICVLDEQDDATAGGSQSHSGTHPFPEVGDRFLGFEIVEKLGESKFGCVYLATQGNLANRFVVLKVAADVGTESERLARLQHTNVVPIYSVHQHASLQAVCMPFLGRCTLASLQQHMLARPGFTGADYLQFVHLRAGDAAEGDLDHFSNPLVRELAPLNTQQLCAWIIAQIADGLHHAHDRGIIHRDLKPANVLLTHHGRPMILDFHLSDSVVAGGRATVLIGGTLPYMAPEHLRAVFSDGHIDIRSDIYSLGVMLFHLLTGELPFPAGDGSVVSGLGTAIISRDNDAPSARDYNPDIAPALDAILGRCLAPQPSDRYQTAQQVREDLELHLSDRPLRNAPNVSLLETTQKWLRRHPRLGSLTALMVMTAGLFAITLSLLAWRGHRISTLEAIDDYERFQTLALQAKLPLGIPTLEEEFRRPGWQATSEALAVYQLATEDPDSADRAADDWKSRTSYRFLDRSKRRELETSLQELLFIAANAACENARMLTDPQARQDLWNKARVYNELAQRQLTAVAPSGALASQEERIKRLLGHDDSDPWWQRSSIPTPISEDRLGDRLRAIHLMSDHQYESAMPLLRTLVQEKPNEFLGWLLLGNCHYNCNDFAEAEACFTTCIALWPDSHLAHFQRGVCRLQMRRPRHAEQDLTVCIEQLPEACNPRVNRGIARMAMGRYGAAASDFSHLIERGRGGSLVYFLRAKTLRKRGREDLAKQDTQQGLNHTPVTEQGWIQRSAVQREQAPELALEDLEQALQLNPRSKKALRNKAHLLCDRLDRPAEAIQTLSRMLELDPDSSFALTGRAALWASMGDSDRACQDAQRAIEVDASARTYYQVACVYAATCHADEAHASVAVQMLAEAVKRDIQLATIANNDERLNSIASQEGFREVINRARELQRRGVPLAEDSPWALVE